MRNAADQGELQECVQAPALPLHRRRILRPRRDPSRPPRPYLFQRGDGAPLGLGGVFETWVGPNGEEVDTACIITTAANGLSAAIHDRLPAIIEPDAFDIWLDPDELTTDAAFALLRPPANDILRFFEIGPAVNKAGNDSAEVQRPVAAEPAPATQEPAAPAQRSLF